MTFACSVQIQRLLLTVNLCFLSQVAAPSSLTGVFRQISLFPATMMQMERPISVFVAQLVELVSIGYCSELGQHPLPIGASPETVQLLAIMMEMAKPISLSGEAVPLRVP